MLLFCMARPCISNCMATRAYSACGVLAVPLPCASRAFAVSWWCNSAALLSWLCNVCAVPLPCICNVFAVLLPRSTACAVDCDLPCGVRSPFSHSLSRRRTCRVPRSLLRPLPLPPLPSAAGAALSAMGPSRQISVDFSALCKLLVPFCVF